MRANVRKDLLCETLKRVKRSADTKSGLPALRQVRLDVMDGELLATCHDLRQCASVFLPAAHAEDGSCLVDVLALEKAIKSLGSASVDLLCGDDRLVVSGDDDKQIRLPVLPVEDFPELPMDADKPETFCFDGAVLARQIDRTAFSMSEDETRPHIHALRVEADGARMRLISTDGHRMSVDEARVATDGDFAMNLPAGAIPSLRQYLSDGNVTLEFRDGGWVAVTGEFAAGGKKDREQLWYCFCARTVENDFPPYDQVIPKNTPNLIRVNRVDFLQQIKWMLAQKIGNGVVLEMNCEKLILTMQGDKLTEIESRVVVDRLKGAIPGERAGFNPTYLRDIMAALDAEWLDLNFGEGVLDPLRVDDNDGWIGVVMPMRI